MDRHHHTSVAETNLSCRETPRHYFFFIMQLTRHFACIICLVLLNRGSTQPTFHNTVIFHQWIFIYPLVIHRVRRLFWKVCRCHCYKTNYHSFHLAIPFKRDCRQTSNIICTKSQNLNVSCLVLQWSLPNQLKSGVRGWRCSWSSADMRCANCIWMINNFFAYESFMLEVWG